MSVYARCSRCRLKKRRDDLGVVNEPCTRCGAHEVDLAINCGQPDWWDEPERDPNVFDAMGVKEQPRKPRAADRVLAFFNKPPRSGG